MNKYLVVTRAGINVTLAVIYLLAARQNKSDGLIVKGAKLAHGTDIS